MNTGKNTPIVEASDLQGAVTTIHAHAQDGFESIASVAHLALRRLESPDVYDNLEPIAQALRMIWQKAEDSSHAVGCEAEAVNASYVDAARMRRYEALQIAKGVSA